jgi:hypothetical protein
VKPLDPLLVRNNIGHTPFAIKYHAEKVYVLRFFCAYTVMHNHYHVVLKVQTHHASQWSETEVVWRWRSLHKADSLVVDNYLDGKATEGEIITAKEQIEVWRANLTSISWLMRSINQYIACHANKEDKCTGHFWQSRFKSQALMDEAAIMSCMAYVDLNPISLI